MSNIMQRILKSFMPLWLFILSLSLGCLDKDYVITADPEGELHSSTNNSGDHNSTSSSNSTDSDLLTGFAANSYTVITDEVYFVDRTYGLFSTADRLFVHVYTSGSRADGGNNGSEAIKSYLLENFQSNTMLSISRSTTEDGVQGGRVIHNDKIYWMIARRPGSTPSAIYSFNLDGSNPTQLYTINEDGGGDNNLAVLDNFLYFSTFSREDRMRRLYRFSLDSSTSQVITTYDSGGTSSNYIGSGSSVIVYVDRLSLKALNPLTNQSRTLWTDTENSYGRFDNDGIQIVEDDLFFIYEGKLYFTSLLGETPPKVIAECDSPMYVNDRYVYCDDDRLIRFPRNNTESVLGELEVVLSDAPSHITGHGDHIILGYEGCCSDRRDYLWMISDL